MKFDVIVPALFVAMIGWCVVADETKPQSGNHSLPSDCNKHPEKCFVSIGDTWKPTAPMKCRRGHVASPLTYRVSWDDADGKHHNDDVKMCPVCYLAMLRGEFEVYPIQCGEATYPAYTKAEGWHCVSPKVE